MRRSDRSVRSVRIVTAVTTALVLLTAGTATAHVPTSVQTPAGADLPVLPCPDATPPATTKLSPQIVLTCYYNQPPSSNTHVATITLSPGGPHFDVVPANGTVAQYARQGGLPDAPVSAMTPPDAVLGVNGGYFDINQNKGKSYTGQACGGMVSGGRIIKTPPRQFGTNANLVVHRDGRVEVAQAGFTGTIYSPTGAAPLTSVNDVSDAGPQQGCPPDLVTAPSAGDGTTLITPDMGALTLPGPGTTGGFDFRLTGAVVAFGLRIGDFAIITNIVSAPLLTAIPALYGLQFGLLATGTQGAWLAAHATPGTPLWMPGSLTVNGARADDVTTLISGGAQILKGGTPIGPGTGSCASPQSTPPTPPCGVFPLEGKHAETMVGISADGRTAYVVVVDDNIPGQTGNQGGLTPSCDSTPAAPPCDGLFLAGLGAVNGVLFDGGGSSTMVARPPDQPLSIVNNTTTGDGTNSPAGPDNQRYVANALVVRP